MNNEYIRYHRNKIKNQLLLAYKRLNHIDSNATAFIRLAKILLIQTIELLEVPDYNHIQEQEQTILTNLENIHRIMLYLF